MLIMLTQLANEVPEPEIEEDAEFSSGQFHSLSSLKKQPTMMNIYC